MYKTNQEQVYDYFHQNAKALIAQYLPPDKQNKGWICPMCGNGSGKDGDGIVYNPNAKKPGYFHCFKCGFDGDLVDLIGAQYGITDNAEMLKKACEIFNVPNEPGAKTVEKVIQAPPVTSGAETDNYEQKRKESVIVTLKNSLDGKPGNLSYLFKQAHDQLNNPKATAYLNQRGLTGGNPFFKYMGYLENHDCGTRYGNNRFEACITFFGSNSSYSARDLYNTGLDKVMKPSNKNDEHPDIPIGLLEVLKNPDKKLEGTQVLEPVFIVEGLFDAPSIAEAGADAIALNGIANIKPIIWAFQEWDIKRPLLLALDNDSAGQDAQQKTADRLKEAGIEFYEAPFIPEALDYKDANDFLLADRNLFIKQVQEYRRLPITEFEATLNRSKKDAIKAQLAEKGKHAGIETGFFTLDNAGFLDGGLYSGLYVIGAISSLGKTTFALQLADQIAQSGQDVIFFSLEMPELEIIGKSISRYTLKSLLDSGKLKRDEKPDERAKSLYEIYRNYDYDININGSITEALERYFKDTGDHLRIIEGIGDKSADDIREEIEKHIKITGNAPVIFIDYLQLLIQPRDKKHSMTDKQITDANIFKLKQISRDFKIPIFGISSFNRDNYNEPVSMKSFKESGAIEYSSDVLIGLEPEYMGVKDSTRRQSERERYKNREEETGIRSIRLVVLKNRNGRAGGVDLFDYYPKYNYYLERGSESVMEPFKGIHFPD